jgi:uncharacterized protein (DUF433 family)
MSENLDKLFTPAEAAALTGLDLKAVQRAIGARTVRVRHIEKRRGKGQERRVDALTLLCLRLERDLAGALPVEDRRTLFASVYEHPQVKTLRATEVLVVDLDTARRQVAGKLKDLRRAEGLVHEDPEVMGGEPVFRGTRIPVRLVAEMLAGGASEAEILSGYPALNAEKLRLASIWAKAHPRRGRPSRVQDVPGSRLVSRTIVPRGKTPKVPDQVRDLLKMPEHAPAPPD